MQYGSCEVPISAVGKLETQSCQWCSSNPNARRPETRKSQCSRGSVKAGRTPVYQLGGSQSGGVLSSSKEGQPFLSLQAFN